MLNRILIADRNLEFSSLLADLLRSQGFEVHVSGTGLKCRADCQNEPPDLLIIDAELHWGSGLGVLASLYEDNPNLMLPVILLLGDGGISMNTHSLGSIFITLSRPVPISAIANAVRRVSDSGDVV